MDRQEYREIISEIKSSYRNRDYERVIMFAQEIPAKKIKENNVLEMIANAYDQVGKPSIARSILEIAYRKMPNGKQTAYKMSVLSLKLDDIEGAVQYYEEFCKIAPNDNQRFILKYEIATEGGLSLYDRIRILEEYTAKETDDRWMYELARLYHEAGMADKCVAMCDDIVVWFSDGDYLKRALELKFAHKALTPTQQAMYERIMQEYIEDYEEPEPEPTPTFEEFEEDAEEFANDFLGEEAGKSSLNGDTKPIGIPEEQLKEAEAALAEEAEAAGQEPEAEAKPGISVSTIKGESADDLVAEIASSIAKNGMAQPRADKKNIFYDFKLELSQPLMPIRKPAQPDVPAEPDVKPVAGTDSVLENLPEKEEQIFASVDSALQAPVVEEELSEEAAFVSERLFAGEEKLPELKAEPEMAYEPEKEAVIEPPALEEEYEKKKLRVSEGQVDINLSLLNGGDSEIDGQLSIDQLFQTYANNIENNLENRAAVAKVEAERLRQIREAVESSMPSATLFVPEEKSELQMPVEEEPAPSRGRQVILKDDTVSFKREQTAAPETEEAEALKDTQIYSKEDVFRIEDEPELAYEDPVDKILREFEEQEKLKEIARRDEIEEAAEAQKQKHIEEKEIEIPAFLKNLSFEDPEEDDLESDLALLEEEAEPEVVSDTEEEAPQELPAAKAVTEEDLFEEIMSEVGTPAAVGASEEEKIEKTEEEIAEELDDLGDFLADALSFESSTVEKETEAAAEEAAASVEPRELTEEEALELDDLGDALADIFGELEEEITEELIEDVPAVEAEDVAEVPEAEPDEEETAEVPVEEATVSEDEPAAEPDLPEDLLDDIMGELETAAEDPASENAEEPEAETEPGEITEKADGGIAAEDGAEEMIEETGSEEPALDEAADVAEEESVEAADEEPAEAAVEEAEEPSEEPEASEDTEEESAAKDEAVQVEAEEAAEEERPEEPEALPEEPEAELEEEEEENPKEPASEEEAVEEGDEPAEEDIAAFVEEISEVEPGDTQPLERIHPFVMSREMREELAEFLLIDGMDEAITNTINNIILTRRSGDATGGHLIITGDKKIGKTFLTISIIKAINDEFNSGSGKVAKVQSESLNGKNIEKVFHKIAGNDLIIENVGDLEEQTLRDILAVMDSGTVNDMIVFEGNMLALDTIINNHPEVKTLFKNRLDVSELTISQWADVACDYAKRQGYYVGDMALLALHAKIDEINMPTTRFGYEDIVNIMETAIERCEKRNTGKLFSAFSRKEDEKIELNESDFI